MAQIATPASDAYNGDVAQWTNEVGAVVNLYQSIADAVVDDTTFIDSNLLFPFPPPGIPNIYVTKFLGLDDPDSSSGHVVRVRAQQLAVFFFNPDNLITELRQGYVNEGAQGTLIATWTDALAVGAYTDFSNTLTSGEADAITNYNNLYLRFSVIEVSRVSSVEFEVPDFVRRARVYWTALEVPYLEQETVFVENRVKRFNEALLLEELAVASLIPSALYFGGGFTNDSGNQFRTWDPAVTPKPGFTSGDLRFTYSFLPTTEDRVVIDAILDAHDGDALTTEQESEDLDQQALDDLQQLYDTFNELNEHQEDDALKLAIRRVLRLSGRTAPTIPATPKPNQFVHDASVAGLQLVPVAGDPASPQDGDLWYNETTNKFRKRENGVTSDMTGGGGGGSPVITTVEVSLGSVPRRAGRFTISGIGLTVDKPVMIQQANGPYTSKGTRADEAEMDQVTASGKVLDATTIECFWTSPTRVKGNFKFDYFVGG